MVLLMHSNAGFHQEFFKLLHNISLISSMIIFVFFFCCSYSYLKVKKLNMHLIHRHLSFVPKITLCLIGAFTFIQCNFMDVTSFGQGFENLCTELSYFPVSVRRILFPRNGKLYTQEAFQIQAV
jgi:hypothetical protein